MRILLDECVHAGLKRLLSSHDVQTVPEVGWSGIKNGRLLTLVSGKYDVFITIDQNMLHQQSFKEISFAVVVLELKSNRLPSYLPLIPALQRTLSSARPGDYVQLK